MEERELARIEFSIEKQFKIDQILSLIPNDSLNDWKAEINKEKNMLDKMQTMAIKIHDLLVENKNLTNKQSSGCQTCKKLLSNENNWLEF